MSRFISRKNLILAEKRAEKLDIHISQAALDLSADSGEIEILDACEVIKLVRKRSENSHKGSFGRLVIIGGSERYPGAPQLSALAALRSGAGICTVITTRTPAKALAVNAKEATLLQISCDGAGFMSPSAEEKEYIAETVASADALLIGPGLGKGRGCLETLKLAIKYADCPIIVDADGINLVSGRIEFLRKASAGLILTPHPAELARLKEVTLSQVMSDRAGCAKELSESLDCVTVAKSAGTVIATPEGLKLSVAGNNGLSRGGSGDLLAGLIGSFAAQGYPPEIAAAIGVSVQGLGCELASERLSRRGMLPSDIISVLPLLFQKIERHGLIEKNCYDPGGAADSGDRLHGEADVDG